MLILSKNEILKKIKNDATYINDIFRNDSETLPYIEFKEEYTPEEYNNILNFYKIKHEL